MEDTLITFETAKLAKEKETENNYEKLKRIRTEIFRARKRN